jgi:hypothetical protein
MANPAANDNPNDTCDEHLDARTTGYAANLHPVHHNCDKVCRDIENLLCDSIPIDNVEVKFPQFQIVPCLRTPINRTRKSHQDPSDRM